MKRIALLLFVLSLSFKAVLAQAPILTASNVTIPPGGTAEVTYTVTDFWNICNFNGTITWDPAVIAFNSVSYYAPPLVTYPGVFNTSQTSSGILSWTWAHPFTVGATIPDGDAFIKISFTAVGAAGSSCTLGFSNSPEPLYWYNFAAWTGTITTVSGTAAIGTLSAPVAAFTFNGNGLTYSFTDASTPSPSSWAWTFGNGATSNLQNPVYTYQAASTYQVCLTVTNAAGSDSICHMVYANEPPVADFTVSGTGLYHTFTSTTTGNPTSYAWTFGDGGTSTQQNPNHQYASYGTYQVCLTATNAGGSDSTCHMVYATMTVGVEDHSLENNISIHADAASHLIRVAFGDISGGDVNISVYSVQGQLLLSQNADVKGEMKLDAGSLSSGVYIVKLSRAGEIVTMKLFIR